MGSTAAFPGSIFGAKPEVPLIDKLSLETEQGKAISANTTNLDAAKNLASSTNKFNREQILQMMREVMPNYDKIAASASSNIESLVKGEIPADVQNSVQNTAAAKALGGGTAGSGSSRNLVARDLGLTSLQLTGKGLSAAESWMKMSDQIYAPGMMNVSSMFVTPMQQYATTNEQNMQQFQRTWMSNQIAAMPDPVASGIYNDIYGLISDYLSKGGGGGDGAPSQRKKSSGGMGGGMSKAEWDYNMEMPL